MSYTFIATGTTVTKRTCKENVRSTNEENEGFLCVSNVRLCIDWKPTFVW